MDISTVGMPIGMSKRKLQQAMALVVGVLMLLSTGAGATVPDLKVDKLVSIIVSKLNPSDTRPEQVVERVGGEVGERLTIVDGFEAKVPESAVPLVANTPGVRGVVNNAPVRVAAQYGENSGVASAVYTDVSRASKAWSQGVTGRGIGVAVIDTGINTTGDLAGKVMAGVDFSGEGNPTLDSYGHGTFVAGLIAGSGAASGGAVKGIAPDAHLISVKLAGRDGTTNVFRLLAGLEYVVSHKDAYGIRVVNLSLGSDSTRSYRTDPLNFAIQRVWNSGIVVVASAGNNGKIVKPADDPLVITVGTVDDKTTLTRTDDVVPAFSGVGPTLSDGIAKPDVVASGRSVVSSRSPGSTSEANFPNSWIGSNYAKGSGTSFSAAVVSGAAALVIQKTWSLNPNQVKHRLMSTSKPLSSVGPMAQGAGSIDAHNAVTSTDTAQANQGVAPAMGGGSLQASSGSSCYRTVDGACISDAEVNAAFGFNPDAYFGNNWAGAIWNASQWGASQWGASQWGASQWGGTEWNASQWGASQWAASQWGASQWGASQWGASQWGSAEWAASQWAASQWGASQWGASQWGASQWGASQWGASQWANLEWLASHWG